MIFCLVFFLVEKNQYVYIVRSVNGKDFQLFFSSSKFFLLSFAFCCMWLHKEKLRENFRSQQSLVVHTVRLITAPIHDPNDDSQKTGARHLHGELSDRLSKI